MVNGAPTKGFAGLFSGGAPLASPNGSAPTNGAPQNGNAPKPEFGFFGGLSQSLAIVPGDGAARPPVGSQSGAPVNAGVLGAAPNAAKTAGFFAPPGGQPVNGQTSVGPPNALAANTGVVPGGAAGPFPPVGFFNAVAPVNGNAGPPAPVTGFFRAPSASSSGDAPAASGTLFGGAQGGGIPAGPPDGAVAGGVSSFGFAGGPPVNQAPTAAFGGSFLAGALGEATPGAPPKDAPRAANGDEPGTASSQQAPPPGSFFGSVAPPAAPSPVAGEAPGTVRSFFKAADVGPGGTQAQPLRAADASPALAQLMKQPPRDAAAGQTAPVNFLGGIGSLLKSAPTTTAP